MDNRELKDTIRAFNKEKQDMKDELYTRLDKQKEDLQKAMELLSLNREKTKHQTDELAVLNRRIAVLEKDLSKQERKTEDL